MLNEEIILQLATKAGNGTTEPSGLVPTMLVFGVMPRLPVHLRDLPIQKERIDVLHSARLEMTNLIARKLLRTAAKSNAPAAADSTLHTGDEVLVYRDFLSSKRVGPFRVIDIDEKVVI